MTDTAGVRVEAMDQEGPARHPWRLENLDGSGTVTVDHLRRRLAVMLEAGRPAVIASVELELEVRAVVDELGDDLVDVWLSVNMPGDTRVYVYSPAARATVGL
jgi:hypothetical protein